MLLSCAEFLRTYIEQPDAQGAYRFNGRFFFDLNTINKVMNIVLNQLESNSCP